MVDASVYDENLLAKDIRHLDRESRTAFAAACAERLWPLVERYAAAVALPWSEVRILREALDSAWDAAIYTHSISGLEEVIDSVESLAPFEDEGWVLESGYAQNGIAAIAYALRSWLSNDPQQAVWAARQVYEAADYAIERGPSSAAPHLWEGESELANHPLEQVAIQAILTDLENAKSYDPRAVRDQAKSAAMDFTATFP